jgi:YidC/Oxa1 family membrane protein insertase
MDRKSIILLVLSVALLMVWFPLVNHFYPPRPLPQAGTNVLGTNIAGLEALETKLTAPAPTTFPAASDFVRAQADEIQEGIENENARYIFTSHGGGLKQIELKKYPETVGHRTKGAAALTRLASLNKAVPIPVLALIDGEMLQGDGFWQVRTNASGVEVEKSFTNGLRVVKTFQFGTNYLIIARVRMENQSSQPLLVPSHRLVIGTATPIGADEDASMLGFFWYDGTRAEHIGEAWFANRALGCFAGTPRTHYTNHAAKVLWAAVHNRFFTLVVMPKDPGTAVSCRRIDLHTSDYGGGPGDPRGAAAPVGYESALVYPEVTIEPGRPLERQFEIFAGPKEYNTLARIGGDRDLVMEFNGFFGFFAKLLLLSMNGLHALGLSYALTIIAITVIIKIVFWPLTQASTRSMKRMAKLQPQMKAIQEKYKDDPKKMNQKLMEFMKEHRVSPMGGCLPMVVQIPFFFGFYRMLQSAIELRGARFLWALDLSRPDTIWTIPGVGFPVNPLPLVMGATMFWQAHLTPPSPGVDPVQQKIMKYMPLMFMVFLYNFSAGLTLYWTVQNLLTIVQMKLTRSVNEPASAPSQKPIPTAKPVLRPRRPK